MGAKDASPYPSPVKWRVDFVGILIVVFTLTLTLPLSHRVRWNFVENANGSLFI